MRSAPATVLSMSHTLSHVTPTAPCEQPLRALVRQAALRPKGSLPLNVLDSAGPVEEWTSVPIDGAFGD